MLLNLTEPLQIWLAQCRSVGYACYHNIEGKPRNTHGSKRYMFNLEFLIMQRVTPSSSPTTLAEIKSTYSKISSVVGDALMPSLSSIFWPIQNHSMPPSTMNRVVMSVRFSDPVPNESPTKSNEPSSSSSTQDPNSIAIQLLHLPDPRAAKLFRRGQAHSIPIPERADSRGSSSRLSRFRTISRSAVWRSVGWKNLVRDGFVRSSPLDHDGDVDANQDFWRGWRCLVEYLL